jgi:hypothetical protein
MVGENGIGVIEEGGAMVDVAVVASIAVSGRVWPRWGHYGALDSRGARRHAERMAWVDRVQERRESTYLISWTL